MGRWSVRFHLAICAVAVLILSSTAAQGADSAVYKRVGPIVTIASGSDWSLTAWRNTDGLCIRYRPTPSGGGTCHVQMPPRSSLFAYLRRREHETHVIGVIARNVVRVQVKERGRSYSTRIYEPPQELMTRLRFFRALVRTGSPSRWQVLAYNKTGQQVGYVGQGKLG